MCQLHGCVTDTDSQFVLSLQVCAHVRVACTCVCMWDCEIEGTRKRAMIKFEVSGMVSIVSSVCDPLPMQIPRVRIQKRPLRWKFLQQHVLWKAWPVDYIIAIKSVFDYSLLSNLEEEKNTKTTSAHWMTQHTLTQGTWMLIPPCSGQTTKVAGIPQPGQLWHLVLCHMVNPANQFLDHPVSNILSWWFAFQVLCWKANAWLRPGSQHSCYAMNHWTVSVIVVYIN